MRKLNMKRLLHYLELKEPFGISRSTFSVSESFFVRIDGGWGEGVPSGFYKEYEESTDKALQQIEQMDLPDPDNFEDVDMAIAAALGGQNCARAAVDMALYDRLGKKLGVPVWKLFGKALPERMVTSYTIGIDTMDVMMRKVDEARSFEILKIKLGRNVDNDIAVMTEIRKAVGNGILRVDANCGWTLDEARRAIRALADLGIEYVEQPLKKGNIEELRELKKDAPLPIYVDEDSVVAADVPRLVGATNGINIKLMKCGGLTEARRMIALARTYDFKVMLGGRIESSLAMTAAAHLAGFADNLDLDGQLLVTNDPFVGMSCDSAGVLRLSDAPGFGVSVRPEYVGKFEAALAES